MTKNVAFVFPGQGSQEVGMGQALAESYSIARETFAEANDILDFPLSQLCFEGPEADLNETINTQVAVFTTSMAMLRVLKEAGYEHRPAFLAGHSLGEYSAYVAAGVMSFADGLRLIRERSRLMKKAGELNPGGMAAILKLDDETVAKICDEVTAEDKGILQVANYNSPGQVVISGHNAAVDRGIELALAAKARRAVRLPVSIAAHSTLMQVIVDEFRQAIDKTPLNLPETPIIANITGEPLTSVEAIRTEMAQQLTSSVRWTASVRYMIDQGVTDFIEVGPKNVLTGIIRRISKEVNTYKTDRPDEIKALLSQEM